MNKTSLGFHTVTIVKKLTREEAKQLYRDFKNYKDRTGEIDFFPLRKNIKSDTIDEFIKWLYSGSSRYIIVHYPFRNIGIHWVLRYGNKSPGFIIPEDADRPCSIKATINPKILSGEKDYLAAATSINLKEAEALFNIEARKISPILGVYGQYLFNRQDYCINFDLQELGIQCTPEQMIYLIRQGDISRHYSERTEYNKASKRQVPDKNSFYLESKSATINCYHKQMQLQKEFPNCPDLHGSRNIIRFEVQCKYLKVYNLSKDLKNKPGISYSEIIREMLSEDFCGELIEDYFNRVVRKGDYFTLDGARWMVEAQNFRREKEESLRAPFRCEPSIK